MYIICTYDVAEKRCVKVMKVLRKYMFHVQNSVFEGELTPSKFNELKVKLDKIINPDDAILFYFVYENKKRLSWKSTKIIKYYNLIFDYPIVFTV